MQKTEVEVEVTIKENRQAVHFLFTYKELVAALASYAKLQVPGMAEVDLSQSVFYMVRGELSDLFDPTSPDEEIINFSYITKLPAKVSTSSATGTS